MDKLTKPSKIRANDDITINGRIYFIPDKYISNHTILSYEIKQLYKIMFALYLDIQITNHKIENINRITKKHIEETIIIIDKLINYITTGKIYVSNLTSIELSIINKVPESLIYNINPNILEKIDL